MTCDSGNSRFAEKKNLTVFKTGNKIIPRRETKLVFFLTLVQTCTTLIRTFLHTYNFMNPKWKVYLNSEITFSIFWNYPIGYLKHSWKYLYCSCFLFRQIFLGGSSFCEIIILPKSLNFEVWERSTIAIIITPSQFPGNRRPPLVSSGWS